METIGAYDAKTHLPRLLAEVEKGNSVTITKHGRPVARLVPVTSVGQVPDVVAGLLDARREVRRGRTSVRSMIERGRG